MAFSALRKVIVGKLPHPTPKTGGDRFRGNRPGGRKPGLGKGSGNGSHSKVHEESGVSLRDFEGASLQIVRDDAAVEEKWIHYVEKPLWETRIKRGLDLVLASTGLVLTSPLILAIAILIKLDSPGSVLFRHERTGIDRRWKRKITPLGQRASDIKYRDRRQPSPAHIEKDRRTGMDRRGWERGPDGVPREVPPKYGKPFKLYKFRTMFQDAPERYPDFYRYEYSPEEFASLIVGKPFIGGKEVAEDPRVTRVGRWLRKTSLDELPNLINVLKGEMSLVGPRPDIWQHIRYYPSEHMDKFQIKPGVTCLAQVKGRGNLTFLETNQYDLEYFRNRSLGYDLKILAQTFTSVLTKRGAY